MPLSIPINARCECPYSWSVLLYYNMAILKIEKVLEGLLRKKTQQYFYKQTFFFFFPITQVIVYLHCACCVSSIYLIVSIFICHASIKVFFFFFCRSVHSEKKQSYNNHVIGPTVYHYLQGFRVDLHCVPPYLTLIACFMLSGHNYILDLHCIRGSLPFSIDLVLWSNLTQF